MPNTNTLPVWPGWETIRLIGRGSFGSVYEIERDLFGHREKAAMKVISIPQNDSDIDDLYDSGFDEKSVTEAFRGHMQNIVAEYSLMREMNGAANVVNCDDVQIVQHDSGIGWDILIRMELLTPLTKALDRNPTDEQVIRIAKDMCRALILCRKHGIIHRDIKPQNIFVSNNGDYKLGDFGIAKTIEKTSGGTKIGTYKYMAPEVYNNRPYNHTADIYSLGLVLYWLLNEKRSPFVPLPPEPASAASEEEGRRRRFAGEELPEPAHGSEELKRIVLKACAYDPKDRYQSAEEMLRALENPGRSAEAAKNAENVFPPAAPKALKPEPVRQQPEQKTALQEQGYPNGARKKPNRFLPGLITLLAVLLMAVIVILINREGSDGAASASDGSQLASDRASAAETGAGTPEPSEIPASTDLNEEADTASPESAGRWVTLGGVSYIDGKLSYRYTYTYTEGLLSQIDEYSYALYGDGGVTHTQRTRDYDSDGNLIRETINDGDSGKLQKYTEYEREPDENKGHERTYDTDGTLTYSRDYYLKPGGTDTYEEAYKYDNGVRRLSSTTEYDKDGNVIKQDSYDDSGELSYSRKYQYDKDGTRIGENWINYMYGSVYDRGTSVYEIDTGGLRLREVSASDWSVDREITEYSYDEHGNCLLTIEYTNSVETYRFEREYGYLEGGQISARSNGISDHPVESNDSMTYKLSADGVLTISGTGKMNTDYSSVPWKNDRDKIISVVIEDGITSIGDYAFSSCANLRSVSIPKSVTSIGSGAFSSCSSLTDILITERVSLIDDNPFYNSGIKSIRVADGNRSFCSMDGVLFNAEKTKLIAYPGAKESTSYVIPRGVIEIGYNAFYYCSNLTDISIPDSVKFIGSYAFEDCSGLVRVTLPNSVKKISDGAFSWCKSLKQIQIPSGVECIGDGIFNHSDVDEFTVSSDNPFFRSFGGVVFTKDMTVLVSYPVGKQDTSYIVPQGTKKIGSSAFTNCDNLTSIVLPSGLTRIGSSAFSFCDNLKQITLPVSVEAISSFAFSYCKALTDVYYKGNATQWGKIDINTSYDGNELLLAAKIHYNA